MWLPVLLVYDSGVVDPNQIFFVKVLYGIEVGRGRLDGIVNGDINSKLFVARHWRSLLCTGLGQLHCASPAGWAHHAITGLTQPVAVL